MNESGAANTNKKWYNRKDKDGSAPLSRQQSGITEQGNAYSGSSSSSHVESSKKLFQAGYLSKMGKTGYGARASLYAVTLTLRLKPSLIWLCIL
jgi:hypothetical protein